MLPRLRIARPVSDLARAVTRYRDGLGLHLLGGFDDHAGFDGATPGWPGAGWQLGFTVCRRHPVAPTPEDRLVDHLPDADGHRVVRHDTRWTQLAVGCVLACRHAACHDEPMLDSLKGLFSRLAPPGPEDGPQGTDDAVRLAAAVLIAQVIRADSDVDPREREVMLRAMRDRCGLSDDEAAQLAALAESTASDATALHTFTSQINSRFGMPRKLRMLELLWRVAYADSSLGDHERHIVRRIADLLHVPQGANAGIRARIAQETLDTQRGAND